MDIRDKEPGQPRSTPGSTAPSATTGANATDAQDHDARDYADEYAAYLRLVQNIPAATAFNLGDEQLHHMPPGNPESGWQNCLNVVEKYDRELCQAYREQMDTLLVFAGLFSAVVTAFAVESYQWLQDNPIDASVLLLRDMVSLLAHTSNTTTASIPTPVQRLPDAAIVRINSFWFVSLTLSLSAALVGILCKQWLREFERNVGQSPESALAVRYIRFQGFEHWKVGSIVTSVPIIMQLALAFFIVGVIELLWCLHAVVACCVTVTAGLTLVFYLATTFLPVVQYVYICMWYFEPFRTRRYSSLKDFAEPQCAFKSAQAWLAFRVCRPLISYLLDIYGYQFSTHYPPVLSRHVLRPAHSWVDFDLNWVKCRENIHAGPRCAFESLTWISANLGELHMNSWIWHCVWARWLGNREKPDDLRMATVDIESVARSYPRIVSLDDSHTSLARSQAHIFRCSVRSDLPIDTALELVLRVTAAAGSCSQWTREALHLVRALYSDQPIRVSDDIAIALFHLSKLQVHAVIHAADGPNSAAQYDAAVAFSHIIVILHRGTHLRDVLIPAMSGFVLQWLRSRPPRPIVLVARNIFEGIVQWLVVQGFRGPAVRNLRQHRGIMFISKLAGAVVELCPEELGVIIPDSDAHAVLLELLAIFSDGFPELSHDVSAARMEPQVEPVFSADVESSSVPVPADVDARPREETHAGPSHGLSAARVTPRSPTHAHLSSDVQVDPSTGAAKTESAVTSPASPVDNPVAPASSPRSPASPDESDPAPSG